MRKRSFFFIGIILILLLWHFSKGREALFSHTVITESFVTYIYRPIVNSLLEFKEGGGSFLDNYVLLVNVKKENKRLTDTVRLLALQNQSLQKELDDNRDFSNVKQHYGYLNSELKPVKILGFDPFLLSKTAWINAGAKQNIKPNYVLITTDGLVGRVIKVFDKSSTVLLLTDRDFAVDAISLRTKVRCLVRGLNLSIIQAKQLPFLSQVEFVENEAALSKEDELITSGLSDIYPEGIPVGRIVDVSLGESGALEKAYVLPAVDFAKLNQVYVLMPKSALVSAHDNI